MANIPTFSSTPQFTLPRNPFLSGGSPASVVAPAPSVFRNNLLSALPSIISTGLSAFTQFQALRAQQDFGKFQQDQLRLQSQAQNLEARDQALAIRKSAMQSAASARALFAGRGIARTGSAARSIEQSFINADQDVDTLMSGSKLRQIGIEGRIGSSGGRSRLEGINRLINIGSSVQRGLLGTIKTRPSNG